VQATWKICAVAPDHGKLWRFRRVLRYAHNFAKVYGLPAAASTCWPCSSCAAANASELRANCERLHHFADASAVEGYLEELASRESAPGHELPRQPGARNSAGPSTVREPVQLPTPLCHASATLLQPLPPRLPSSKNGHKTGTGSGGTAARWPARRLISNRS